MTLYDRLKTISKKRGLTLQQVTERAGLGAKTVYKWKSQSPSTSTLQKVADVLNTSTDFLLGNTDNPDPAPKVGKPKAVDLADRDVPMMFEGRPVSDEDRAIFEAILRRHDTDER